MRSIRIDCDSISHQEAARLVHRVLSDEDYIEPGMGYSGSVAYRIANQGKRGVSIWNYLTKTQNVFSVLNRGE